MPTSFGPENYPTLGGAVTREAARRAGRPSYTEPRGPVADRPPRVPGHPSPKAGPPAPTLLRPWAAAPGNPKSGGRSLDGKEGGWTASRPLGGHTDYSG